MTFTTEDARWAFAMDQALIEVGHSAKRFYPAGGDERYPSVRHTEQTSGGASCEVTR